MSFRASRKQLGLPLDGMDEKTSSSGCAEREYQCIGDLCMGKGLVGLHAYRNGKRFVGTELNHKRLSVLIEAIVRKEESIHAESWSTAYPRSDSVPQSTRFEYLDWADVDNLYACTYPA